MRINELAERYGAKPTQARYDALIEGIKESDKSIVSVVRCKDCKWWFMDKNYDGLYRCANDGLIHKSDWYCADGERREEDE